MALIQVYGYHEFDNATLVLLRQGNPDVPSDNAFQDSEPVQPALVNPVLGEYLTRPLKEDHKDAYFEANLVAPQENRLSRVDFSTVDVNAITSGKDLADDGYRDSADLQVSDEFYEDASSTTDMSFMYGVATNRVVDFTQDLNDSIYEEALAHGSVDYFTLFGKDRNSLVALREDVKNQRFNIADVNGLDADIQDDLKDFYDAAKEKAGVGAGKLFSLRNVTFAGSEVYDGHARPVNSTTAKEYVILTSGIQDSVGHDLGVEETIWDNAEKNRERLQELENQKQIHKSVDYNDLDL